MCGRLSQYDGIHDFVAALSMSNALVNHTGDLPFERYNAAPSTQLALFHQEGQYLHADMVRWGGVHTGQRIERPPLMLVWKKWRTAQSSEQYGHTGRSSR